MSAVIDGRQQVEKLRALYKPPNEIAPTGQGQGDKSAPAKTRVAEMDHSRLPARWRDRLPAPVSFYAKALPNLSEPDGAGQAASICPLHCENTTAMVTINLASSRGCWNCPVCGKGDMMSFCMRLYGLKFVDAVRVLIQGART